MISKIISILIMANKFIFNEKLQMCNLDEFSESEENIVA